MEIFPWPTGHHMNMHAKKLEYEHAHIFIEKYFMILLHVILYNTISRKYDEDSQEIYFIFFEWYYIFYAFL
jgi:hypothetical protein